ncbi:hypothetical protein [Kribbella alba]|uniref:hypothetical protein n=1 Tax=Kribbella alba TaxID=190197 RepID=UPI0031DA6EA1
MPVLRGRLSVLLVLPRLPVLRWPGLPVLRRPGLSVLRRPGLPRVHPALPLAWSTLGGVWTGVLLPARLLPLLLPLNVRPPGLARCPLALQRLCWWLALWMDWLGWALLWLSRLD